MKRRMSIVLTILSLVFGFSLVQASFASAAIPCGAWIDVWAPPGGGWGSTYSGTCAHWDFKPYPEHTVTWTVTDFTSGQMCVRARGYRWSDAKPYWKSLGCQTGGHGVVHWGLSGAGTPAIIAVNQVQASSQTIVFGVPGYFTN